MRQDASKSALQYVRASGNIRYYVIHGLKAHRVLTRGWWRKNEQARSRRETDLYPLSESWLLDFNPTQSHATLCLFVAPRESRRLSIRVPVLTALLALDVDPTTTVAESLHCNFSYGQNHPLVASPFVYVGKLG